MYRPRRATHRLLPMFAGLCLALAAGPGVRAILSGGAAPALEGRIVVRSGDPAPGVARFGDRFDSLAATPDGLLFIDAARSALFLKAGDGVRTLSHCGQRTAGGSTIASLRSVAAGPEGTIAFLALLADGREGIVRTGPEGGEAEEVVVARDILDLRGGPATVGFLYPPVVDVEGAVLASIAFSDVPGALVRFPRGRDPQILMQTGDPLGPAAFEAPLASPAAGGEGRIAFSAGLDAGGSVVASIAPGAAPVVRFLVPPSPAQTTFLAPIPPAIDGTGRIAFLVRERGALQAWSIVDGVAFPVATAGTPAPGGGTFREIGEFPPAFSPSGQVLFGAARSDGRKGFYLADGGIVPLAETGAPAGDLGTFTRIETRPLAGAAAAFGADATFHVVAAAGGASGILSVRADAVALEVGSEEAVPEPRFVAFLDTRVPFMGGGPALAPGGLLLFDAQVTGGSRGLFSRDRSGTVRGVVMHGDPAPDGGRFDGRRFAFHSINESGVFAFLGSAAGGPSAQTMSLFYGSLTGGGIRKVTDVQPFLSTSSPAGDRVDGAPSRIDRAGRVAVPVTLPDLTTVLMGYDGTALFQIAGPGDPAPAGETFTGIFTGSMFNGLPVPPALEQGGRLLFGAQAGFGGPALYAARVAPGGGGVPVRVLGTGDEVEGGRLTPFEILALDQDAAGRVAFQSIYSDEFDFADFLLDGAPAERLAARLEPVLDRGFVMSVLPALALLGEGSVGYGVELFGGQEAILVRGPEPGSEPLVLAATGDPSPDGGTYAYFQDIRRNPGRLASDGRGTVALAAGTTAGPEAIVLFGGGNAVPAAEAGADLLAECSGPDGAAVTLDGAASSDPDGDVLAYRWTGPFGEADGPRPTVTLPLGVSIVSLVVDDGQATSPPDTVRVEVLDTRPPALVATATPSVLWPPDGRYVEVALGLDVSDACDPSPAIALVEVATDDPGAGRPGAAVHGASPGTDDRLVFLRAGRSGAGAGRTYALLYRAIDRSGNAAEATALVAVPHDRRR